MSPSPVSLSGEVREAHHPVAEPHLVQISRPRAGLGTSIPRSSTTLLAAGNPPDHECKPWEVDEPGMALQVSPHLGLLGGHTDVQSWSLGQN